MFGPLKKELKLIYVWFASKFLVCRYDTETLKDAYSVIRDHGDIGMTKEERRVALKNIGATLARRGVVFHD